MIWNAGQNIILTKQQRQSTYQGFNKYTNEVQNYELNIAGLPNNGIDRNSSLSNSAGSAALAALRLHQTPQINQSSAPLRPPGSIGRINSLNNRSNSLKTYVYHPKGSYTPGQATIPNARRYSSLTSNKAPIPRSPVISHMGSTTSMDGRQPLGVLTESHRYGGNEEADIVITTQTTKVVDGKGRLQSITTKTIKTLPDGSNIIETTARNISRTSSRNNSLRNNSLLTLKHENYNLHKIDETLQDFEYNYELDSNRHLVDGGNLPHDQDLYENSDALNLNVDTSPTNSVSNKSTNQAKPLKSILKTTPTIEQGAFEDDSVNLHSPIELESPKHPYKTLGSPASQPPKFKVPDLRESSKGLKQPGFASPNKESNRSVTSGNSIKFNDNVETIPIYESDFRAPKVSNQELYNKAMQVAMEKVYGQSQLQESSIASPNSGDFAGDKLSQKVIAKKDKQDKLLSILGHSGVNDNYIYENHHRDFKLHSLRDGEPVKESTHKERAKLEKKKRKEYEKLQKEQEKQKALDLKRQQKLEADSKKQAENDTKKVNNKRSLFRRRKKDTDPTTIASDLSSNASTTGPTYNYLSPLEEPKVVQNEVQSETFINPPLTQNSQVIQEGLSKPLKSLQDRNVESVQPNATIQPNDTIQPDEPVRPDERVLNNVHGNELVTVVEDSTIHSKKNENVSTALEDKLLSNVQLDPTSNDPDGHVVESSILRPVLNEIGSDSAEDPGLISDLDEYEDVLNTTLSVTESNLGANQIVESSHPLDGNSIASAEYLKDAVGVLSPEKVHVESDVKIIPDESVVPAKVTEDLNKQNLSNLIISDKEDVNDTLPQPLIPELNASSRFSADLSAAIKRIADSEEETSVSPPGAEIMTQKPPNKEELISKQNAQVTESRSYGHNRTSSEGLISHFTLSTTNDQPETTHQIPDDVYKEKIVTSSKPKKLKQSKFKEKILKYFVNSYDRK